MGCLLGISITTPGLGPPAPTLCSVQPCGWRGLCLDRRLHAFLPLYRPSSQCLGVGSASVPQSVHKCFLLYLVTASTPTMCSHIQLMGLEEGWVTTDQVGT